MEINDETKYMFKNPNSRFLEIIYKFTRKNFNPIFFQQDLTDREFLAYFHKNHKPIEKPEIKQARGYKRYQELVKFLHIHDYIKPGGKYLDVGCGDASITIDLGKFLDVQEIYGTDIIDVDAPIIYQKNDGKSIPFDTKFNLVTMFQSLHHMHNLDLMLKSLENVTAPGSYLIIREHNLGPVQYHDDNKRLFMLEHAFYDIVYDGKSYDQFIDDYYAYYRTETEWDILLEKSGFKKIKKYYIPKYNPTNYYYALYKRV
jgi:SAM-dependent methyltransferase